MAKIKILVDSSSDITKELAQELDITVVPLITTFEDGDYKDFYDLTPQEFYKKLETSYAVPTTSNPNPNTFEEYFRKFADYDDIICVTLSSNGSGTYNSACIAKNNIEKDKTFLPKVHIVDTLNASLGVFLCAKMASTRVKFGDCAKKIVDEINETRHRIGTYIVPETLTYLKKGGRVNTISAIVGTLLGIKPIITIIDGWGRNFGICRNDKQMYQKLSKFFTDNTQGDKEVYITHANCYQKAQKLIETLNKKVSDLKITVSEMGTVMGTHVGPGSLGIYFIQNKVHTLN